jgi:hypothetical protein
MRAQFEVASGSCSGALSDIATAKRMAGPEAADAEFKEQLQFGADNKCASAGVQ